MPFGSFNKKSQSAADNRVGASDNAIVLQNGGFLFNPGRALENDTLNAGPSGAAKVNWPVVAVAAGALVAVYLILKR